MTSTKIKSRQNKYKNILKKDFGIETTSFATKNLMICNVGLVNNCSREEILQSFEIFGKIETIVMPEMKSYCFIRFFDVSDANNCCTALNGKPIFSFFKGPIYLVFTESVPDGSIGLNFQNPPGLQVLLNIVSVKEEEELLKLIEFSDNSAELKHRKVKHYGYEFLYGSNYIDVNKPLDERIPDACNILFERMKERGHGLEWMPDQMTVNQYLPGQGIPSHVDTHSAFEDPILSLSLGSDVVMEFKKDGKTLCVDLPRFSILIMSEDARFYWKHGITPRKSDMILNPELTIRERGVRTSFTFRKVRCRPCECIFPSLCDSRANLPSEISDEIASQLEKTYVHSVYDQISDHFSDTRHKPWPNVLNFVRSLATGSVLIDVGCGNGKYFGLANLVEIGVDQCSKLIEISSQRGFPGIIGNCLQLPFKDSCADGIISIAVIHHLSTKSRRINAIEEMVRVLKRGGQGLIYTWAKNQVKDEKMSSYLKQSKKNRKKIQQDELTEEVLNVSDDTALPVHSNRTDFKHQDVLVPWKLKYKTESDDVPVFHRFYHVFEQNELEELCSCVKNVKIIKSYYDQGNWCVVIEKCL